MKVGDKIKVVSKPNSIRDNIVGMTGEIRTVYNSSTLQLNVRLSDGSYYYLDKENVEKI